MFPLSSLNDGWLAGSATGYVFAADPADEFVEPTRAQAQITLDKVLEDQPARCA